MSFIDFSCGIFFLCYDVNESSKEQSAMEVKVEPWRPKSGDMIQVWDSLGSSHDTIREHGEIGYVVRPSKKTDSFINERGQEVFLKHIVEGNCFQCIFFTNDGYKKVHMDQNWLRLVRTSEDVRKVKNDS